MMYIINTGLLSSIWAICVLATVRQQSRIPITNTVSDFRFSTLLCQIITSSWRYTKATLRVCRIIPITNHEGSADFFFTVFLNALLAMLNARDKLSASTRHVPAAQGKGGVFNLLRLPKVLNSSGSGTKSSDDSSLDGRYGSSAHVAGSFSQEKVRLSSSLFGRYHLKLNLSTSRLDVFFTFRPEIWS